MAGYSEKYSDALRSVTALFMKTVHVERAKPMKISSLFSVAGAAFAAAILSLTPLMPASAQDTKPLVRAISSDVNSLDPHDTRGAVDQDIMLNIYEKLVEMEFKEQKDGTFMADPMGVVPNLAEVLDHRRAQDHLQAPEGCEILSDRESDDGG